jgi:hypothetical protein
MRWDPNPTTASGGRLHIQHRRAQGVTSGCVSPGRSFVWEAAVRPTLGEGQGGLVVLNVSAAEVAPPVSQTATIAGTDSLVEEAYHVSNAATLINAIVAVLWVGLAFAAVLIVRNVLQARGGSLTRFGVGPSGVTMEFAEAKLDEAVRKSSIQDQQAVGQAAKRSVLDRLQRNSELLSRARILWTDDHPEYNTAIVELLRRFGAAVETPRSNAEGLALLQASRYDVVISDVARDNEGPGSNLKGLEFAEQGFQRLASTYTLVHCPFQSGDGAWQDGPGAAGFGKAGSEMRLRCYK